MQEPPLLTQPTAGNGAGNVLLPFVLLLDYFDFRLSNLNVSLVENSTFFPPFYFILSHLLIILTALPANKS